MLFMQEMDTTTTDIGYELSSLVVVDQAAISEAEEVVTVEDAAIWVTPEEEGHLLEDLNTESWLLACHPLEAGKTWRITWERLGMFVLQMFTRMEQE